MRSDIDLIAAQERELQFTTFDPELAWRLGSRLRELSQMRGHSVVIDISRLDFQVFYCAVGTTTLDNAEWVRRKRAVTRRFQRSSYRIGLSLKADGTTLADKFGLGPGDYAAHGGSFPINVIGTGFVGTVTVSGLPQRSDHELIVEALCGELNRSYQEIALPREA